MQTPPTLEPKGCLSRWDAVPGAGQPGWWLLGTQMSEEVCAKDPSEKGSPRIPGQESSEVVGRELP